MKKFSVPVRFAWVFLVLASLASVGAQARTPTESEALAIDQAILGDAPHGGEFGRFFPYGYGVVGINHIPNPDSENPDGEILETAYTGDSAIWTGHYLAAVSYRYAVTRTPEAKASVWLVFQAIEDLVNVTGQDLLARSIYPEMPDGTAGNDKVRGDMEAERGSGVFRSQLRGKPVYYVARTSRDQYTGAFLGLSIAHSLVDDPELKSRISKLVVRMIEKLKKSHWHVKFNEEGAVYKPNSSFVTFLTHTYQIAAIFQVGKQVAPERGYEPLRLPTGFWLFMIYEGLNPYRSYYKFNLAHGHLLNLIRLEQNSFWRNSYLWAFKVLRANLKDHVNPYFNMVERAIAGPDPARDAETRKLIGDWLDRDDFNTSQGLPIRRDYTVDRTNDPDVKVCKSKLKDVVACQAMPVLKRVNTDFLWQRSPHQLFAFGDGHRESNGIDYVLPYWMARCYGVLPQDDGTPGSTPCAAGEKPGVGGPFLTDEEAVKLKSPIVSGAGPLSALKVAKSVLQIRKLYKKREKGER